MIQLTRLKDLIVKTGVIDTLQTIFISFLITAIIYTFFAIPNVVEGASMEGNFHNGDLILTNKFIQILQNAGVADSIAYEYERGDVIVFQKPSKPDFIKRIVAGPGDVIKLEDGFVFVNGKQLHEDYIDPDFRTRIIGNENFIDEGEEKTVPQEKYFVLGDNRIDSQDSRFSSVGWVDKDEIKGRVFFRYWPLSQLGLIQRGTYEEIEL